MTAVFIFIAVISLVSAAIYVGLLLWAAIEDGRDQVRRNGARHG